MEIKHLPVLKNEVLNFWVNSEISKKDNIILVDATCGEGGHSLAILQKAKKEKWLNKLQLICFDQDEEILTKAKIRLKEFQNIIFINANFINLKDELSKININKADGILFDLGISNFHYKESGRGFSFTKNEDLDMRLDKNQNITATRILNEWSEDELENIFRAYSEEKFSKRIAEFVVKYRPINTTKKLSELVSAAIPTKFHYKHIHPATKIFQALRIAVNNELENLSLGLEQAVDLISENGHILVISFHSLEDRIVKNKFKEISIGKKDEIYGAVIEPAQFKTLTHKPIVATITETKNNPASRSVKLRIAEKN